MSGSSILGLPMNLPSSGASLDPSRILGMLNPQGMLSGVMGGTKVKQNVQTNVNTQTSVGVSNVMGAGSGVASPAPLFSGQTASSSDAPSNDYPKLGAYQVSDPSALVSMLNGTNQGVAGNLGMSKSTLTTVVVVGALAVAGFIFFGGK